MDNKSFLFFNKEGYPHNFTYDTNTESWNGKIIFDENSDQTFKTQSLYIFESVEPITFDIDADLIEMNYHNNSGITIVSDTTYTNQEITNIIKTNESSDFYSKWVYGLDFHKKFPIGTVVYLSGVTGTTSTDFNVDNYFTVLAVKKNAFLIVTETSNDIFNFSILSGYTSSLNMISINDYNRDLSTNNTLIQNLYPNKKFSIIDSISNDSIVTVKQSGITTSYLNEIKIDDEIDKIFTLSLQLFTQKPILLQNNIILYSDTITTGTLNVGKYAYLLSPEIIYTNTGQDISKKTVTFEDELGNQLFGGIEFTIDSLITESVLGTKDLIFKTFYDESKVKYRSYSVISNTTKWNTIQYDNQLDIKIGDIISLSGVTTSGNTGATYLMNNREFSIIDVIYDPIKNTTMLFVSGYIIDENNSAYIITKKLQSNQIKSVNFSSSGDISLFTGNTNNAYCYSTSNILNYSQSYISGNTNNISYDTITAFLKKYKNVLNTYGIDAYYTSRNNTDYLSVESLYGAKYNYFSVSGYTNDVKIVDNFDLSVNGTTNKYDIIINEKLINEKTNKSDTGLYKPDAHSEIVLNLQSDNDRFGFKLTLNSIEYSIDYSVDSQTTINNFINIYYDIMYSNGYNIYSGYTSEYSGYTLNIQSDIDIWNLEIITNILSTYKIIENQRNKSILLSGNELKTTADLFNLELSTGMLLKITGSTYNTNNKEYNIISLTENNITLSYQGVFTSDINIIITGTTREFIRKPRGDYNRDVYLNVSWKKPYENNIDESIFFYDISGDQLTPYNNIENLRYTGPTPLINLNENNIVILNNEANNKISEVNNPKAQQTIFNELNFKLEQLDSSLAYDYIPEPLEIFFGYNSTEEGFNTKTINIKKLIKSENNNNYFSISGYTNPISSISLINFTLIDNIINISAPINFNFKNYFEIGQLIKLEFIDQNEYKQLIQENINIYKISDISRNKIYIDTEYTYENETGDYVYSDSGFTYFNTTGNTYYYKIEVQPKEILSCVLYGQTEIEDIRFKVNLNNLGVQLEDDIYEILYQSDIEDKAIDYILLNKKRKEMLLNYREIYDYVGSYKALINAINFFGYNDLYLYEYYRNINKSSALYGKLHKILIPDMFDNSVQGWTETDFISAKYQNNLSWKKTNLFNLSYSITDNDGDNILIYSLDEVQYKLTKLKTWLRKHIIPLSTNLVDITGVANTEQTLYQNYDESNQVKKTVVNRKSTVVNFNYTSTLNFGTDYLVTVNFYVLSGTTGTILDNNEIPNEFSVKIKTFYLSGETFNNPTETLIPVQYIKLHKTDLTSFSFSLNKNVDPYIYIETTTYDNDGNGIGYINNKLFYYDEPRNYWLVNHNFDLTKMVYLQTENYIDNNKQTDTQNIIYDNSTLIPSSVETIVKVNTLNQTYISQISTN